MTVDDAMTDAKDVEFIESLLHSEECGRSLLYDVYGNEVCSIAEIVNHIDTLTRERDDARRSALQRETDALRAERDTLRSRLARSKAKKRRYFGMLKWQLQELRRDHARLDWLSDSAQFEAIGIDDVGEAGGFVGLDMYEHASIVAAERGNEGDLTDSDLRKGFRRMIDAAMAVQPATGDIT